MTDSTARSPWIVSPVYDSIFFLATPLLCLAAILPLAGRFASTDIYLAVMAFSSFGHHLPGFLRAYGDRELFARFRWRFLLAPPLVYAAFWWFAQRDAQGLVFLLVLWSIWHVMMQHFGFMRIYDAKVGSTRASTALLDRAVSLLWFVAIVLWSPEYTHNILRDAYASGAPLIPTTWIAGARTVVFAATALATVLYVVHTARLIAQGAPLSRVKLVLLVVTIGFLWLVWVGLKDILLGLAIWEVFHDVQYFAITWVYNKRLVEKGFGNTGLMRFLFRGRAAMVALYVGAIVAYGSFNWFAIRAGESPRAALIAIVLTSTFLHYYYDGFIWKVRQDRTREGLDLETGAPSGPRIPGGVRAGVVQVLGILVPIGSLAAMELSRTERDEVELREALVRATPDAVWAQLNLGRAYSDADRHEDAVAAYERALEVGGERATALGGFATGLLDAYGAERADEAASALREAMELAPEDTTHAVNLAILRFGQNRVEEAIALFERVLGDGADWVPRAPSELLLAGLVAMQRSEFVTACERFAHVLHFEPENRDALEALSLSASALGRHDVAEQQLRRLLELEPDRHATRVGLVECLLAQERLAEAIPLLEGILEDVPDDQDRRLRLAEVLATGRSAAHRDGARAVSLAREVVEFTREQNVGALDILGAAFAEAGDFGQAIVWAEKALALANQRGMAPSAKQIEARIELYRMGRPFRVGMFFREER